MTDKKISELTALAGADMQATDQIVVARASTSQNFSMTRQEFLNSSDALLESSLESPSAVKALDQGVATTDSPTFAGLTTTGDITVTGTVDGRDIATDGAKLDGIEAGADVTDTANVTAAGALMESSLESPSAVKALDQGVATTDSPSFAGLALTGDMTSTGALPYGLGTTGQSYFLSDFNSTTTPTCFFYTSNLTSNQPTAFPHSYGSGVFLRYNSSNARMIWAANYDGTNPPSLWFRTFRSGTWDDPVEIADADNLAALGALMDSELTNITAVKALDQGVATTDSPTFAGLTTTGDITVTGTVDGRDIATDGAKLDGIEAGADVTDTANVTAAGALMESSLESPSAVRALANRSFASRAAAVTEWAAMVSASYTPPIGTVWTFDGVSIEYDGSTTAISDLTGWVPSGDVVSVEQFGAVRGLDKANGATNTTAFQAAMDYVEDLGGGAVHAMGQYYTLTGGIRRPAGVYLCGAGVGEWEPIFPARAKGWEGTSLVFANTGTRDESFAGATSMRYAGGWREDPDSGGSYFKLTSFYDADASGATAATIRAFSVAVMPKDGATHGGLRNLRIVNWIGSDGIDGWSDEAETTLGDDWDIGYCLRDHEFADDHNIQVVGGWREFGHLMFATNDMEVSKSERNHISTALFQGRVGLGIRGADRWEVSATTTTTATIRWSEESYWGSTGAFRGSDGVDYTYTGTTRVSTDLRFDGVSPDPTGIFTLRHAGAGFANSEYENVYAFGLDHVSGDLAGTFSLNNSKPLEISGYPLRGVKFRNCKALTREAVVTHLHDATDLVFIDCQFEGGGHMIASPAAADASYATAPVGDTRNLVMIADHGVADQDRRLFLPRSGLIQGLQLGIDTSLDEDFHIRPFRSGGAVVLEDEDGNAFMRAEEQSWTPALRYVTVTHVTQTGTYVREGDFIHFALNLEWSGLDTADTSGFDIQLPVTADSSYPVSGQIMERTSTGINLSSLSAPHLDVSAAGGLGITYGRTSRLFYNTAGILSAAGTLQIVGMYRAA